MKESEFQRNLKAEINIRFPGALVIKEDSNSIQGIPDLLILYKDKWASLECKKSGKSHIQPNQEFYVNKMNEMGFSRFIFPENRVEVLNDLDLYFKGGKS